MADIHSMVRDRREILESTKLSLVFLSRFKMAAPQVVYREETKKKGGNATHLCCEIRSDDTSLASPLRFLLSDDRKCHRYTPEVMRE